MGPGKVRIAAAGDIHAKLGDAERLTHVFAEAGGECDLILLAGDLTGHGDPAEAAELAAACRGLEVPVIAVLGNHDWNLDRQDEVTRVLEAAEVTVLQRSLVVCQVNGLEVGVVATKGFIGGFPGASLPDFGERLLRQVYAESSAEVRAVREGLATVAHCPIRIVLLHYSPSLQTLRGEPEGIWAFLGDERLAGPVVEHRPDLVLHGHAHAGTFEGAIGATPVFNVAIHVTGRDFWYFDLEPTEQEFERALLELPQNGAIVASSPRTAAG
jgi:Icc-related predicted phosphoesterase